MSLRRKLRSMLLNVVFNPRVVESRRWLSEKRRQVGRQPHVVSVFLQLDDPYSYILSHYLPNLAAHYDIELRWYLSEAKSDAYQPAPDLLAEYAVTDCARLALELGIPFLDKGSLPPTEHRVGLSDAVAATIGTDDFEAELRAALAVFWRGDSVAAAHMCGAADATGRAKKVVAESQRQLQKLGHYNSAMLHYAGEWFWGVDRLNNMTERKDKLDETHNK